MSGTFCAETLYMTPFQSPLSDIDCAIWLLLLRPHTAGVTALRNPSPTDDADVIETTDWYTIS